MTPSTILQEGDQIHLVVDDEGLAELRPMIMEAHRRMRAGALSGDRAGHAGEGVRSS